MEAVDGQPRYPTKVCTQCSQEVTKAGYAKRQWRGERPVCLSCAEKMEASDQKRTKLCSQCGDPKEKDQFPKKQWKKERPLCRLCYEMTNISGDQTRQCHECKLTKPRDQFDIRQWGSDDSLCHGCRDLMTERILGCIGKTEIVEGADVIRCEHSREHCDSCRVDYTLPNQFARKRAFLGRGLTADETKEIFSAFMAGVNNINRKICILDGQPMCPRSGRKLRCPCDEVTYCSKPCQLHHWTIHKMTCKAHLQKKKEKAEKKRAAAAASAPRPRPAHGLTEGELNNIRIEAFFAENSGVEHAIEECAWELGEHPLVIGGGSVRMGRDGTQEFVQGDVAKIYMDAKGVVWDGSPRFGMGPYVQRKARFDWIAKSVEQQLGTNCNKSEPITKSAEAMQSDGKASEKK